MTDQLPLNIGILGAAAIAPTGLIKPAKSVPEVQIVGVAARDVTRARAFAQKHGLPRVFDSYDAMLADPDIDAVFNPLPNGLHAEWTIRALRAGKHVLCEKPFSANADEAERMAQAAQETGLVLSEAFHFRYHPLATRVKEILTSGELGTIRHIEGHMCFPLPTFNNIRWRFDLAGGTTMDAGSYPISFVRFFAGEEPEVTAAHALLHSPQIDRYMTADLRFPGGYTGRIECSMWSRALFNMSGLIRGEAGELYIMNPYHPQYFNWLTIRGPQGTRREHIKGESSYTYGLRAFAKAIRGEGTLLTGPADAVANMRVIDAVYEKAGLKRRGTQ